MTVINTNIKSLIAANAMTVNNRNLQDAMTQLSTGSRINSARDDAAGLAISSKIESGNLCGVDEIVGFDSAGEDFSNQAFTTPVVLVNERDGDVGFLCHGCKTKTENPLVENLSNRCVSYSSTRIRTCLFYDSRFPSRARHLLLEPRAASRPHPLFVFCGQLATNKTP